MIEAGAQEIPRTCCSKRSSSRTARSSGSARRRRTCAGQIGKTKWLDPSCHAGARELGTPTPSGSASGGRSPRGCRRRRGARGRALAGLSMDSGEEDILRRTQVKPSLARSSTRSASTPVAPVLEQFGDDLRALTDAEQDSKELKSAKRHLLFERIEETGNLGSRSVPRPSTASAAGQGRPHAPVRQARGRVDLQGIVRRKIAVEKNRPDGRDPEEIRPIECEVGVSPRTHGSGLFQRGQTQIMSLLHARYREGGPAHRRPLP